MEADFVFWAIGWPHPRFYAEEWRFWSLGPGYECVFRVWEFGGSYFDFDNRVVLERGTAYDRTLQFVVNTIDEVTVRYE